MWWEASRSCCIRSLEIGDSTESPGFRDSAESGEQPTTHTYTQHHTEDAQDENCNRHNTHSANSQWDLNTLSSQNSIQSQCLHKKGCDLEITDLNECSQANPAITVHEDEDAFDEALLHWQPVCFQETDSNEAALVQECVVVAGGVADQLVHVCPLSLFFFCTFTKSSSFPYNTHKWWCCN